MEGGMTRRSLTPRGPSPTLPRPRLRSLSLRPLLSSRYAPPSLRQTTALDCLPCGDLLAVALGTSAGLILVYSLCRDPIRCYGVTLPLFVILTSFYYWALTSALLWCDYNRKSFRDVCLQVCSA
ncbi:hypothetical protein BHE74_00036275 [Ensete ventricosum]|nr:hypothetical protein BHE74_00036275 [Ensete ventricosum]